MADSVNAFTVYSSLELQINEFVQQLNRASQILDSTLQNMSGAVSALNMPPVEVNTEANTGGVQDVESAVSGINVSPVVVQTESNMTGISELENAMSSINAPTITINTETEPLEPVTVPPADDRNFIQKIKDSFSNLKNTVKSVPSEIAGKFKEMGTEIVNNLKSFPSNVSAKFSEIKTLAIEKIKEIPSRVAEVITSIPSKIGAGLKNIGTNISDAFKSGVESAKKSLKELPEKASEALKETGEKLKSIAETVAKAGTVAISAVSAGVVAFGKSAVDTGKNFDKSMSQVAATMGKSVEEVADLREFAQEMGRTTAFSATDSADALNYMALAGYDAETSMKMLPNVLNLASAGGMELALASDMITDSQSALGLSLDETTQLVDKMAKASSKSNTSVSQLGDAILTVGGTAKKLKGGTTELATVLGILADNGIKGSEGGTALRNIMNSLISPTEDATAMLEQMGTSLYDEAGNMRSLNDVFIDLRNGMDGLATQAEKDQVLTTIFNARDLKSAEALIANVGDRFNELSAEIDNCSNSADAMAKTQLDNLAGDVTLFQSALEGAKIAISDQLKPALRDFVKMGSDAMSEIAFAFESSDDLETAVFKMGRYLQGDIYRFVSKIVDAIPQVVSIATTLVNSVGQAIVKNIPKIANSAVRLLKGFAENIAKNAPTAIKGFSDMLKKVSDWIKKNGKILIFSGMEMIKSISQGIYKNIPDITDSVKNIVFFVAETISKNLPLLLDSALNIIGAVGQGIINNLPLLVDSALEIIRSIAGYINENLPEIIPAVIDVILQIVETLTAPETLSGLIDASLAIITGLADGLVNSLPVLLERLSAIVQNIIDVIIENVPKFIDVAVEITDFLCTELLTGKNLNNLIKSAVDILNVLIDAIVDNIDDILLATEQIITTICDELLETENLKKIIKTGAELLGKLITGLCQIAGKLAGFAGMMFAEVDRTLRDIDWAQIGIAIVEGICSGMFDCDFVLADYLGDFGDNLLIGIQDIFDINSPSRLMKDEVGKYLALGVGEGFVENVDGVSQQISDAVSDWTSIFQGGNFMDNLIDGVKSKEKSLVSTLKDVAGNIGKAFEKPVAVNADVSTDEVFNLKLPDISGADFMENLINGVKSKEKSLVNTLKDVVGNIRKTFEKPITVNTDITVDENLNRLKFPDISTVAENIHTVKHEDTPDYRTEKENPVNVENLNIYVEGTNLNSEYETERFINMIADRLNARAIRKSRGTGGVIF